MLETADAIPTVQSLGQFPIEAAEPLEVMMEAAEVEAAEPLQLMMEAAEPLPPPLQVIQPLQTQGMEAVKPRAVVEVLS